MEGPANTLNYMIAGYTVIFVVIVIYLVSLVIRWRNLRQDEEMLEQMNLESDQADSSYESGPNIKTVSYDR